VAGRELTVATFMPALGRLQNSGAQQTYPGSETQGPTRGIFGRFAIRLSLVERAVDRLLYVFQHALERLKLGREV
jgi:hypothetical protein